MNAVGIAWLQDSPRVGNSKEFYHDNQRKAMIPLHLWPMEAAASTPGTSAGMSAIAGARALQ